MAIRLSLQDRYGISMLYPEKENLKTQLIICDIDDKIKVTKAEELKYKITKIPAQLPDGRVVSQSNWDDEKELEIDTEKGFNEFTFTDIELDLLKTQAKKQDSAGEILKHTARLYNKLLKAKFTDGRTSINEEQNET